MPDYIFVDDEPESILEFRTHKLDIESLRPGEVTKKSLQGAKVVLVDWNLRYSNEDAALTSPSDGFDVAALLRSWADLFTPGVCVAFCMYSGELDDIREHYAPGLYREHAMARTHGLEWVFDRATSQAMFASQATQLAILREAVVQINELGTTGGLSREMLQEMLCLEGDATEQVWTDIEESRPPSHDSWQATSGRGMLRWLLHRILPYPTFLIDEHQVAAKCRLSICDFRNALKTSKPLEGIYEYGRYKGILSEFIGPRWWAHKINQRLWDLTDGRPFDPSVLQDRLSVSSVSRDDVILCVDGDYKWEDELTPIGQAVRVAPEDWPAFAHDAWMRIERIKDTPDLMHLVPLADRRIFASA